MTETYGLLIIVLIGCFSFGYGMLRMSLSSRLLVIVTIHGGGMSLLWCCFFSRPKFLLRYS